MKKILITGENSYIGEKITQWLEQWPDDYEIHKISIRGDKWKRIDFSTYNSVIHTAGIVHTKETNDNIDTFYRVNRDLTLLVASLAKKAGVKQFIFMSTMNVYGVDNGIITKNTPLNPKTAYGKSKLEAEKLLSNLQDNNFRVAIIRPPMVYGPKSDGNYIRLSKFSKMSFIFPNVDNKRSMIHINNLAEFIRLSVKNNFSGIFCPQNKDYINISNLVYEINNVNNKKVYFTKIFNPLLKVLMVFNVFQKIFGSLTYSKELSSFEYDYNVTSFSESVHDSEILKENE